MPQERHLDLIRQAVAGMMLTEGYGAEAYSPPKAVREGDDADVRPSFVQYIHDGNQFRPVGPIKLVKALQPFAYRIETFSGTPVFIKVRPRTDELYEFKNSAMTAVMEEIDQFWKLKPNFEKLGLLHHRGILVYGPPGTGKSAMMQQVAERMVQQGNVLFFAHGLGGLLAGLQAFHEIESTRRVVVVLEDLDEYLQWSERDLLQLLDGENSVDNVLFLASTNYVQKFPPRLLRPGRFDRKVFLNYPPIEGRRTYLQHKLKDTETAETIEDLAGKTDGMSFGHLRELVIAAYAFKESVEKVLRRLKGTGSRLPERPGRLTVTEGRVCFESRRRPQHPSKAREASQDLESPPRPKRRADRKEDRSGIDREVDELVQQGEAVPNGGEGKFQAWMKKVDATLERIAGLSSDDLPDKAYRDWFDAGMTPERAARKVLADEGF